MKKFNGSYLFTAFMLCLVFSSCVLTNKKDVMKPKQGLVEMNIEGDLNTNFHAEGDCGAVSAKYFPLSEDYDDYRAIMVQGKDGDRLLTLILYFKGDYPSNPVFPIDYNAYGQTAFGIGSFVPDIYNTGTFYSSDDANIGTCTITEYDQVNQTISGTFSFSTQGYSNGAELAGVHASFTGTFTNVPISDLTDPNNPRGPCYGTTGTGLGEDGGSTNPPPPANNETSITYKNNSFTPIDITINNETKIISPGSAVSFSGKAGSSASGTASASGKTSTGEQVGLKISWTINNTFPSSGTLTNELNVGSNFFFLRIINKSSMLMTKLHVNYNLVGGTTESLTIGNDGKTYNLGYYAAYTNSNVRVENGNVYWFWQTLNLPFTQNQSITLTGN